MAALSFGFDELERRLDLIRRRHNLYALQDAFCRAGTVILGGGAVVLAIAGVGNQSQIRPAVAVYLVVALGVTAHFALRVHRAWLSLDDAAELADREAGLDCRLATLLAQRQSSSRSRLRALLLSQVFLLASRWTAQRVAPRRFPRSVAAFAAALFVFVATAVLAPAPPEPETAPATTGITAPSGVAAPQLAAARSSSGDTTGEVGAQPAMTEGGTNTDAAPGAGGGSARDGDSAENGVMAPGGGHSAKGENSAAAPLRRNGERSPGASGKSPPEGDKREHARAQPAPEAAASSPDRPDRRGPSDHRNADESHRERAPGKDGDKRAASSQPQDGDDPSAPGRRSQQQTETNRDPGQKNPGESKSRGGDRSSRGGEHGPAEKSGLYGNPKGDAAPPSDAAAMLIKLTAFSAVGPQEFERQGKGAAADVAAEDGARAGEGDMPLAEQLNRETPLLRAPLAVEHESIVREIFTPR